MNWWSRNPGVGPSVESAEGSDPGEVARSATAAGKEGLGQGIQAARPGFLGALGRVVFTAVLFIAVAALGQIPFGKTPEEAYLRLALRTTEAQVEICRDRTAEELDALPAHMRQPRVCDRHAIAYRLRVDLDGDTVLDEILEPRGARGDQPLVFDRRIAVEPGEVHLGVSFVPDESAMEGASAELVAALAQARNHDLVQPVQLEAGRITLVRLDGDLVIDG